MARVPYLDKSDLAPENQELLARNITLHRALAHSPNGLRAFGGLGTFIRHKSRLDPRLRELAILQVDTSRAHPTSGRTTSRSAASSASRTTTSAP